MWSGISSISLSASRPECFFGADVPLFYVMSFSRVGLPLIMILFLAALHALSAVCGCSAEKLDRTAEKALRRTPAVVRRMSAAVARRTGSRRVKSTADEQRQTDGVRPSVGSRGSDGSGGDSVCGHSGAVRGALQSFGEKTHRTWRAVGANISRRLTRRQDGLGPLPQKDGERSGSWLLMPYPMYAEKYLLLPPPLATALTCPFLCLDFRPSPGDRLELIETIIIQTQMTSSWRICAVGSLESKWGTRISWNQICTFTSRQLKSDGVNERREARGVS